VNKLKHLSVIITAIGLASGSIAAPITERDIAATAASFAGASVLDVARYTPSATLAGCAHAPKKHGPAPLSQKMQQALAAAQAYSDSQNGIALMVVKDGRIVHESYRKNANAQTQTESLSMMKSVTALATGIAIDKGIISSVDDPIGKYLTEWRGDKRGEITLRELLTMSSGLKLFPFADAGGPGQKLAFSADIKAVALAYPLSGKPGGAFQYNNVNSQLVGTIIDRQVRKHGYSGFPDFLQQTFWCPLRNGRATLWLDRNGGSPHYYAGLQANIHDWARIGELIRNNGKSGNRQIVSKSWITEMLAPSASNPAYGLHIWRGSPWQKIRKYDPSATFGVAHAEPYRAHDVYFFDGFGGQRVYIIRSQKLTIVRVGDVSMTYDDSVIVNQILGGLELAGGTL
jgi:CubicO group peptidase (beta-lactamase class C family)